MVQSCQSLPGEIPGKIATLNIASRHVCRDCQGLARRDFLRIGSLGLTGLALSQVLSTHACASKGKSAVRDKSVVFLFLCGGPSQIETFDPHMDSPEPARSVTGEVQTRLAGVTFGGTFPKLAALADRLAVVRSYAPHGLSDHAQAIRHVFAAGDPLRRGASIGSIATRLRGASHPSTGMPSFCELVEDEVDSQYMEDMVRMRASNAPGQLGAAFAPFRPQGDGPLSRDMRLNLPLERLQDRRRLLRAFDRFNRALDDGQLAALDRFEQQALDVILGKATREALDLSREDRRVLQRYDTGDLPTGFLKQRPSTIGRQLLLARRLCEAGCTFVTVGNAGWDNHGNGNHPGVYQGMHLLGTPLDRAVSAFLEDVRDRGLSDKILLVITGEFGRTPRMEQQGGRGHWPGLCPLVFAGGGLKMGQVIGRSTRGADRPATEPIPLSALFATIMHALFDVGQLRIDPALPRDLVGLLERAEPIAELL
jgi:uncharacterized protein (DUF1501 family)